MLPVVDACVAIKWFLPEKGYENAASILDRCELMLAPDLFYIEMDAIITKKVRQKLLEPDDAPVIYKEIRNFPFKIIPYSLISKMALDLSTTLPVTQYDACYLSVAIEYNQVVLTADQRFYRAMQRTPFERYVTEL